MNGVEILNVIEIKTTPIWLIVAAIISLIILCICFSVFYNETLGIIIGCVFTVAFVVLLCLGVFGVCDQYNHTEYQVIISDEVNFNEFSQQYEVIKQDGKIYTVREKETE